MIIIVRFKSFSSLQDIVDITLEKICKVGSLENKLVESTEAPKCKKIQKYEVKMVYIYIYKNLIMT